MLSIIVAKAKNNVIGKDGQIPWKISDDLKQFKEKTTGHNIIMGRKTFDSLGRILPNRKHIILSKNPNYNIEDDRVEIVHSIEELKKYIDSKEENFVIGGAVIYELLMPYCNKMYVTEINKEIDGDTVFPNINKSEWEEISRVKGPKEENNLDYDYVTYIRILKGK